MNTTDTEQRLLEKGIQIEDLVRTAYEEVASVYYNYPKIRSEFEIGDIVNDVVLYFLKDMKKYDSRRLDYYLQEGKDHFMNTFKACCRQTVHEYSRYNFMKYKASSLNSPVNDDSETEYIDMVTKSYTEDTESLNESLDEIFNILYEKPKNIYLAKKKQECPGLTDLEIMLNVHTRIDLYRIREKAELEQKIIKLLNEGYKMREIKKILNCPDIEEDMNNIKEVFTEYYHAR